MSRARLEAQVSGMDTFIGVRVPLFFISPRIDARVTACNGLMQVLEAGLVISPSLEAWVTSALTILG